MTNSALVCIILHDIKVVIIKMKNIIINNIRTSYYITKEGKCYNSNTGKFLKGQVNPRLGYFSYSLTMPDGSKKRCVAHRLVAIAYIPNDDPKKDQVNHIDGNKLNNCVSNLEWCTQEENQQHAIQTELRKFPHLYCFNKNKELVAEYKNIPEASKATGIGYSSLLQALRQEEKVLCGNFYWSREKELGKTKEYRNTGKAKRVLQYDLNNKYIMTYPSVGTAARALGLSSGSHIGECCRGKIKSYKGYIWKYEEDIVSTSNESQRDVSKTS